MVDAVQAARETADSRVAAGPGYQPGDIRSLEGDGHATEGKLPLRQYAIRGSRGARRRDALHLFAVRQARRTVGLLHAFAVPPDVATRKCRDLSVAHQDGEAQFLRQLRLRHLLGIA